MASSVPNFKNHTSQSMISGFGLDMCFACEVGILTNPEFLYIIMK